MFQIKLVNISSNDIVDGNQKLTLGLVWNIILHWQVIQFFFICSFIHSFIQQCNLCILSEKSGIDS